MESNFVIRLTNGETPAKIQTKICSATALVQIHDHFSLLSLPPEIRRIIYAHYFACRVQRLDPRYYILETDPCCSIYSLKKCHSQILTVSRQLYYEAREVLYRDAIWHLSFKALSFAFDPRYVGDASLQAFRSRPEFRCIRNISVGVMFQPTWKMMSPTSEEEKRMRLKVSRRLLRLISHTLFGAVNLRTVKLLWHDRVGQGDWQKKRDCLKALARLPEKVRCTVHWGSEAAALHSPEFFGKEDLSIQEHAAKADLNQFLKIVREQFQARSRPKSVTGLENNSLSGVEHSVEQARSCFGPESDRYTDHAGVL